MFFGYAANLVRVFFHFGDVGINDGKPESCVVSTKLEVDVTIKTVIVEDDVEVVRVAAGVVGANGEITTVRVTV